MECVLERPLILLTDRRISVVKDLLPILEQVVKLGRALLKGGAQGVSFGMGDPHAQPTRAAA
jgi:hypothetical protein